MPDASEQGISTGCSLRKAGGCICAPPPCETRTGLVPSEEFSAEHNVDGFSIKRLVEENLPVSWLPRADDV